MTFKVTSHRLGVPQIVVSQTQAGFKQFLGRDSGSADVTFLPGQTVSAYDRLYGESRFILAYGVGSNAIGAMCRINNDWSTTLCAAATRGRLGVSMSANTDTAALSWYCIEGHVPVVASTVAVNLPLYLVGAAGAVTSTVTATNQATGLMSVLAASGTVTTKTISTVNGSAIIEVPDFDGLYVGMAVTGTGVAASSTISEISEGGQWGGTQTATRVRTVRLNNNCTATGSVTGTFAHPAGFCTAAVVHPVAAGLG